MGLSNVRPKYAEIAGSPPIRVTTSSDVRRAHRQDVLPAGGTRALGDLLTWFSYNGHQYPVMPSMAMGHKQEEPDASFVGYVQGAYKSNGIVFACELVRLLLFSEARFQFREFRDGRPGDLFGTEALRPLERPWPNATTGDLLSRAILDADLAGNFYAARMGDRIKRMRPDWVTIVLGSDLGPDDPGLWFDAEILGYVYSPGGLRHGADMKVLMPEQVAHFAPVPDPLAYFRGMSWLTPVIREIMGDNAATQHKLTWFEDGATKNYAVNARPDASVPEFKEFVKLFKEQHADFTNAFKTVFMAGGASIEAIGSDMRESAFKEVTGAGETRIAAAAGVPPIIAGFSEGLQSATYSNYGQARRRLADGTMRPLWRNFSGSIATIIDVPDRAELWYDDRDIPFLQEDVKDAVDIIEAQSRAIRNLWDGGAEPDSAIDAVVSGDLKRLKHSGMLSVQMQKPGENEPASNGTPIGAVDEPGRAQLVRRVRELAAGDPGGDD